MIETIYNIISQYILLPLTIAVFPVDYQTEAMLFFQTTIKILAIVVPVMIAVAYFTYAERKVIGFIQGRIGPNRVGLFGFRLWGLGQPIADAVKLIAKEIIIPLNANRSLFIIAPILSFAPALAAWAVIPFDDTKVLANINAGLLLSLIHI